MTLNISGPFKVTSQPYRVKADHRVPAVCGEQIHSVQALAFVGADAKAIPAIVDGSGLGQEDSDILLEHSVRARDMWVEKGGEPVTSIEFDLGELHNLDLVQVWNYNRAGLTHRGIGRADVAVWTEQQGWTQVLDDAPFDQAEGTPDYDDPVLLRLKGVLAQKVRFVDIMGLTRGQAIGLSEVQFFKTRGKQACKPVPGQGGRISSMASPRLYWTPGLEANAHRVYLGTSTSELSLLGEVSGRHEVQLSSLAHGTEYNWRVDEVQADGSVVKGEVWSFSPGDLVAHWKFDEAEGSQAADASGHNHTGNLMGDPAWRPSAGKLGGALEFDGDGDYVDCGNAPAFDMGREITLAAWIKVHSFDKEFQAVVAKGNRGWRLLRNRQWNSLVFAGDPYASRVALWGSSSVHDGRWYHVAATYDGRTVSLYVNGEVDDTRPATDTIKADDQPVYIGENPQNRGSEWNGLIDEVRIYDFALGQNQIKALFQGQETETSSAHTELPRLVAYADPADQTDAPHDDPEPTEVAEVVAPDANVPAVKSDVTTPTGTARPYPIIVVLVIATAGIVALIRRSKRA